MVPDFGQTEFNLQRNSGFIGFAVETTPGVPSVPVSPTGWVPINYYGDGVFFDQVSGQIIYRQVYGPLGSPGNPYQLGGISWPSPYNPNNLNPPTHFSDRRLPHLGRNSKPEVHRPQDLLYLNASTERRNRFASYNPSGKSRANRDYLLTRNGFRNRPISANSSNLPEAITDPLEELTHGERKWLLSQSRKRNLHAIHDQDARHQNLTKTFLRQFAQTGTQTPTSQIQQGFRRKDSLRKLRSTRSKHKHVNYPTNRISN